MPLHINDKVQDANIYSFNTVCLHFDQSMHSWYAIQDETLRQLLNINAIVVFLSITNWSNCFQLI